MCLHGSQSSICFNLICNMTFDLATGVACLRKDEYVLAFAIPFNLI